MSEINRRNFLKYSVGVLAGAMIPDYCFAKEKSFDFSKFSDEEVLARMLFGEARSLYKVEEDVREPVMIGYTALNRAEKSNYVNLKEAILAPKQYSCFNPKDVNYNKIKNPGKNDLNSWKKSLEISKKILNGLFEHLNYGQTHYHRKDKKPKWRKSPKMKKIWGQDFFKHYFYKEL